MSHAVINARRICKGADLLSERLWLGWFGSRNDIAGSYVLGPVPHSRDFSDEAQHRLHCQLSDSHDEHLTCQLQQLFHILFAVNLQDLGSLVTHNPRSIIDQCGRTSQKSTFHYRSTQAYKSPKSCELETPHLPRFEKHLGEKRQQSGRETETNDDDQDPG